MVCGYIISGEKKVNESLQKENVKKKAWKWRYKNHGRAFMIEENRAH